MDVEPVTLEGRHVRLEPLEPGHHPALCAVGLDPEIWRWYTSAVLTPDQMRSFIDTLLRRQAEGTVLPFVTVDRPANRVVGGTTYLNVDRNHRRVEIGNTWIAPPWQRTAINTEAKLLMLRHAFETLGCIRVEFKTDSLNERSRAAILRLGAREEGIFRNHMICDSGRIRHSAYFSIIDAEWPSVKSSLEAKLEAHPAPSPDP